MSTSHGARLGQLSEQAVEELSAKHESRERGLQISREVIRLSANAIRAVHRREFEEATGLLARAGSRLKDSEQILKDWPEIYYAGFLSDARKEYSEGCVTLALISGTPIPEPSEIPARSVWKWPPISTEWRRR